MIHLALFVAALWFLGWVLLKLFHWGAEALTPSPKQPVTRERWDWEVKTFGKAWARQLYRVVPDTSPELTRSQPWWLTAD